MGFPGRRRPLWLRDMHGPLGATHKTNTAQEPRDKDASEEEEEVLDESGGGLCAASAEPSLVTEPEWTAGQHRRANPNLPQATCMLDSVRLASRGCW